MTQTKMAKIIGSSKIRGVKTGELRDTYTWHAEEGIIVGLQVGHCIQRFDDISSS